MMGFKAFSVAAVLAFALGGCTSMSVFKDSEPTAPAIPKAKVAAPTAPALVPEPLPGARARSALAASQIRTIVAGKTFRWESEKNSGTTIFARNGTSLIEVDGKGTASGKWVARDGQLCESVNSGGTALPEGSGEICRPFSRSGSNYQVGPATFTPS